MGGLFESNTASKYNTQQKQMTKKATKKALKHIDYAETDKYLADEYKRLQDGGGFRPSNYSGPGHNIGINKKGNITMTRTGEAQGFMDRLLSGLDTDEGAFGSLLSQISPGFGRFSKATSERFDQDRDRAVGNLREQLAKRRVLGASFANDQIGSLERQYLMDKEEAMSKALLQELEMTNQVIQARSEARNKTISTGLSQIQFETGIGADLQKSVMSNMHDISMAMTDIAKLRASLNQNAQLAKATTAAGLAMPGLNSQTEFAQLESQEKAAPGQLLGTLAGAAIGGLTGGGLGIPGGLVNNLSAQLGGSGGWSTTVTPEIASLK